MRRLRARWRVVSRRVRLLFVMDGLDRVDPDKDTSFGLIAAACERGHQCLHALIHQVERVGGEISAVSRRLGLRDGQLSLEGPAARYPVAELDAVFIRTDPPFDQAYSYATLLLEMVRDRTLVINEPRALREANEKLYTLQFPAWMPETVVSADRDAIARFVAEVGGKAVIKPLDGNGGFGVLALSEGDSNLRGIIDLLTREGRQLAVVQRFIPEVTAGDKRVLLLDGELLGAILRVPPAGELRANIHVGAKVVPTELTARERELVADMAPRLRADGLYFVGLDLVGEQLTEVNVTSPTGIRELSRFSGQNQSARVITWVEKRVGRGAVGSGRA